MHWVLSLSLQPLHYIKSGHGSTFHPKGLPPASYSQARKKKYSVVFLSLFFVALEHSLSLNGRLDPHLILLRYSCNNFVRADVVQTGSSLSITGTPVDGSGDAAMTTTPVQAQSHPSRAKVPSERRINISQYHYKSRRSFPKTRRPCG